jgi:hypothetical protein
MQPGEYAMTNGAINTYSAVGKCSCGTPSCQGPFPAPTPDILLGTSTPAMKVEPEPNVISEIDGWQMTPADEMIIPWMYNTCSILSHYCEKNGWRQYLSPDDMINAKACPVCHELIPDSVLAVWHLWNADEITKYSEQIREWNSSDENKYTEDPLIYMDSKPLGSNHLFEDPEGNLYMANGELYDQDEMSKWNGSEPQVLLFAHDETVLSGSDDERSVEATSIVV